MLFRSRFYIYDNSWPLFSTGGIKKYRMITKEKIARINQLAAKKKSEEGLTATEEKERNQLHKEYIAFIRSNVKDQLKRVKFVEDLTEEEKQKYLQKDKQ